MNKNLIDEAVKCIRLHKITLHSCSTKLADEVTSFHVEGLQGISLQVRHQPKERSEVQAVDQNSGDKTNYLRFKYECGARIVDPSKAEDDDLHLLFLYESVFSIEFLVPDEAEVPSEDALDEFAYYNLPHAVWPYWREHLQSSLVRSGLPQFTLPMFTVSQMPERGEKNIEP